MRYSFDTYRLYNEEGRFAWTIRVRVAMKEAVDGLLLEVTSMSNRIFVSFMQLLSDEKYRDAFREVLDELGVPYRVKGPFPKHLPRHDLPGKAGQEFWLCR